VDPPSFVTLTTKVDKKDDVSVGSYDETFDGEEAVLIASQPQA
jgi:hypothetical protein